MTLTVFNSLTRQKEPFVPLEADRVNIYVCGVTVYDFSHVGHARVYVVFDVITRWLRKYYDVKYVRNFTDVDDKIIRRASEVNEAPLELAQRYIDAFHEDMTRLGVLPADVEPRVSTHIQEIIEFVDKLIQDDFAYTVEANTGVQGADKDVFFRVRKAPEYTQLSGRNLDDLQSGARVEVDSRKEDPLDFALWKAAKKGELSWPSPFGDGRPGWHIECSAMSSTHLGPHLDIHGGGKDLVFPHHTNEIAQSETFHGKGPFSRYWLHNGFVNVESEEAVDNLGDEKGKSDDEEQGIKVEKMSKSLDNFFTIREVLTRYSSEALRLFLLSAQYRAPLTYGLRHLEEAERRVQYLYQTMQRVDEYLARHETREGDGLGKVWSREGTVFKPWDDFEEAMDNDFNTPQGLAAIFEMLKVANLLVDAKEKEAIGLKLKPADRSRLLGEWQKYFANMVAIFGVGEKDPTAFLLEQRTLRCKVLEIEPAEIEKKIQERVAARANKDFETADRIRGELHALGVEVRDTADGVDWAVV